MHARACVNVHVGKLRGTVLTCTLVQAECDRKPPDSRANSMTQGPSMYRIRDTTTVDKSIATRRPQSPLAPPTCHEPQRAQRQQLPHVVLRAIPTGRLHQHILHQGHTPPLRAQEAQAESLSCACTARRLRWSMGCICIAQDARKRVHQQQQSASRAKESDEGWQRSRFCCGIGQRDRLKCMRVTSLPSPFSHTRTHTHPRTSTHAPTRPCPHPEPTPA